MRRLTVGLRVLFLAFLLLLEPSAAAVAAPEGTMTWGVHITLASRWLDPAETEGIITPFMVLYALHDALVKPSPAGANTPSLAESWSQSKDGLTFEFVLRKGVKFHNGEPVTAEDVKFSFERYRGAAAKLLKERVKEVHIVEVEDLFQRQARELDAKKREALLYQIQQILHDRVMQIPIYELAFIWGVGPRVEEPGINLIRGYAYSAPYEDLKLKRP
jgi:ABC-type transport system substrate-binding protein